MQSFGMTTSHLPSQKGPPLHSESQDSAGGNFDQGGVQTLAATTRRLPFSGALMKQTKGGRDINEGDSGEDFAIPAL